MMRIRTIVAGLLQAGLMACGQTSPADVHQEEWQRQDAGENRDAAKSTPGLIGAAAPAPRESPATGAEPAARTTYPDPASGMIVRTGTASIEVDSLEPGLGAVRALAARLGGYVGNTSLQGGGDELRRATVEIKVPAARFDDLTAGLDPLGRVESVNVSAEDVSEEYVDLGARAANARRLEERLIDLLATRTGKLQDVLSVERELARVREEIERLDGRMRFLKSRATMSTLSVALHEPPPIIAEHPGGGVLAEAFRQAWRNFVELLAGGIAALGYLVPVGGLIWAAIVLGRRVRRLA
jgi:hypothetical protein